MMWKTKMRVRLETKIGLHPWKASMAVMWISVGLGKY